MAKKYWIALGEHGAFTRDDHYLFQVFFTGQTNGKSYGLFPMFVQADDIESARAKLHKFIDDRLDHELHMLKVEEACSEMNRKRAAFKARPVVADKDINSLSIGGFVGDKP